MGLDITLFRQTELSYDTSTRTSLVERQPVWWGEGVRIYDTTFSSLFGEEDKVEVTLDELDALLASNECKDEEVVSQLYELKTSLEEVRTSDLSLEDTDFELSVSY